jgi:hypothetical protein
MGLLRTLFELLVFYLLYKLIFDFIIPVYKTTKQLNQKMSDMQQHMHAQGKNEGGQAKTTPAEKPAREDYIDFEEVK